jgi:hypothetical protein
LAFFLLFFLNYESGKNANGVYINVVGHINMKSTVTILLMLIQFCVLGQSSQWDNNVIKINKVDQVSIYAKVPKTNPAHPLKLKKQFAFDSEGRIVVSICKDCTQQFHRADGKFSADVIEKCSYENSKLLKIERKEFEESTDLFYYNKSGDRRLKVRTDNKGERVALALSHLDKQGRETLTYDVDFDVPYPSGDSVSQVFIDKSSTKYESDKIIRQTYNSSELVNMGRTVHISIFKIFNSSIVPAEIENTLSALDLTFLKPWNKEITEVATEKIQIKNGETNKVKTTYIKDKNGLIVQEIEDMRTWTRESVYEYTYRN